MEKLQLSTVCTPTDKRNNTVMDTSIRTEMFLKIKGYIYKKAAPTGEDRGRYSEYRDLLRYALSDISPKHKLSNYLLSLIAAWAAARRAMGTRKGLQDT